MSVTDIQCNLNSIIVNFNDNFKENMKELVDFMEFTLTEYNNMKTSIEHNLAKVKNSKTKKVNKRHLSKASVRTRNQCKNDISEISTKNVPAEIFIDVNDSIACRTRGAMRAIRESKSTKLNVTHNFKDVTKIIKGKGRVKGKVSKASSENNNVNNKRSAEEEADVYDVSLKKIRQENLSNCELLENEEKIFKKPINRSRLKGKKTNDSIKNTNSDTLAEDFQFFNNPIVHSSPNASIDLKGSRTFVVSPNSISNIKASPKQDSTIFSLRIPSVKEKVAAFERMGSEVALSSGDHRQNSKTSNLNEKITDTGKKLDKKRISGVKNSDEFVSSTSIEKKEKLQTKEEFESNRISPKNLNSNFASTPEQEVVKKSVLNSSSDEKRITGEGGIIRSSSLVNQDDFNGDGETTKSKLCQQKKIHEKNSNSETLPNEETEKSSPSVKNDLNVTKKITKASKRTKPVLKPTIFDSMGNIIKNIKKCDEPVATAAKKNSSEKSYVLRSSANILSTTLKKDSKIKKEVDDDVAPHIDLSISGRESNEENKPESGGKKKAKTAKKKYENVEIRNEKESASSSATDRITRSKEAREQRKSTAPNSGLIILARKSLKKAKRISFHQNKLKSLQGFASRVTPQKIENHTRSTSKTHLVTPLHTITNNIMKPCTQTKMAKIVYPKYYENTMSTGKGKYILDQLREREMLILNKVGPSLENSLKSSSKNTKENELEKEMKLKIIKEKEEEASMKREQAIKSKREELKRKNEMKLQSAMKQRKKLEEVKYNNIIQTEKQKEAKHKQLLEERDKKLKERTLKKKQLMEQKLAETEERRRLEEEARIAKLKEQEAEQERIMREKQKELERHEKRAQERLAQEKAKEQYELNLKLEQMKVEKILAQARSANKTAKPIPKSNNTWNYRPRNENDYGLDDENSELDSDCEEPPASNRPLPTWAKRVKNKEYHVLNCVTQDLLMEYMPCYQKTPDIHKMFKMTPNKRIKRTSSAIWNTPSS